MDFFKIVLLLALTALLVVNDSTQFLVANCVWDEALADAPIEDLKGFVLSDSDACALFCGKPNGAVVPASSDTPSAMSPSNAALCDRCCKSSQPPSKPGELLVTILQTLIKAFAPSKDSPTQTISTGLIPPEGKPVNGATATSKPPPAETTKPDDPGPVFDFGDTGSSGTVNLGEDRKSRPAEFDEDSKKRGFQSRVGRLQSDSRQDRPYPEAEARIYETPGGSDGPAPAPEHAFTDGFDRADRGAGWPNRATNFPLKSGPIR